MCIPLPPNTGRQLQDYGLMDVERCKANRAPWTLVAAVLFLVGVGGLVHAQQVTPQSGRQSLTYLRQLVAKTYCGIILTEQEIARGERESRHIEVSFRTVMDGWFLPTEPRFGTPEYQALCRQFTQGSVSAQTRRNFYRGVLEACAYILPDASRNDGLEAAEATDRDYYSKWSGRRYGEALTRPLDDAAAIARCEAARSPAR